MSDRSILLLPIARTTFDLTLAEEMTQAVRARLQAAGFQLQGPESLLTDLESIEQSCPSWTQGNNPVVVILQTTFADSTLINRIADELPVPLLLWGFPEAPTGARLRLNSFCGINLAAHSLKLRNHPYSYLYSMPDDPEVPGKISAFYSTARAYSRLREARLGILGEHPPGMDSCHLDATTLEEKLGIEVKTLELAPLFKQSRQIDNPEVVTAYEQIGAKLENLDEFDREKVMGTLGVYRSLEQLATEYQLDGLAVRCWPEFFTELGCAACGALSLLSDNNLPCSCEADANGTLTQMLLSWLSDEPSFGTDMVYFDCQADTCVLWHCGLAPLSMADPAVKPQAALHSNRKVPLVMDFPLKPGRVTLARLSRASGSLVLVLAGGEMLSATRSFSGTSGVLRFDRQAAEVLDAIMHYGLEHHLSLTYGDYQAALETIAQWLNIPVLHLTQ
jgi:L-fucose isomerase-like protein